MIVAHIYWFAYYNGDEPSVRYRAMYPLAHLKKQYHVTFHLVVPGYRPGTIWNFLTAYCSALFLRKKNSVIVFEKIHTNRLYANALKFLLFFRHTHTVYDIDDADYLKFPPHNIDHFIRNCAQCAAGSASIANYAARLNSNAFLLTSPIWPHGHIKGPRNTVFTIGWIGYYNAHRESLHELFFPCLAKIPFPVHLVLMGVVKPEHVEEMRQYCRDMPHVTLDMPENIDWQDEKSVYERIATFDVGIAPLLDTEINKAKSAFKLKQYLSCGVPALASGLGENMVFLRHGINGYRCNSHSEYLQQIIVIHGMTDHDYRALSANALRSVPAFSLDNYCHTFLKHICGN